MQDDTTNSGESEFQHADTDVIGAAGTRVTHAENNPLELPQCYLTKLKTACADTGETHIQIGGSVLGSDLVSDTRTDRYKKMNLNHRQIDRAGRLGRPSSRLPLT